MSSTELRGGSLFSTAGVNPESFNRSPFGLVGTTAADLAGAVGANSSRPEQQTADAATILPTTTTPRSTEAVACAALWEYEWQGVLSRLELPSTRMLLSQQVCLLGVERTESGLVATVGVTPRWLSMVAGRRELMETAFEVWYGRPVRVALVVEVEA